MRKFKIGVRRCLRIPKLPPLLTNDITYPSNHQFCLSHILFARPVWPPFLPLFECMILRFVYERILLRFVYFVMNLHLLILFVLSWDKNSTRLRICCFLPHHSPFESDRKQNPTAVFEVFRVLTNIFLMFLWIGHNNQRRIFRWISQLLTWNFVGSLMYGCWPAISIIVIQFCLHNQTCISFWNLISQAE